MKYLVKLLLLVLLIVSTTFAESFKKPPYDNRLDQKVNGKIWYDAADTDYVAAYNIGVFYQNELKEYKFAEFWYKHSWDIKKNSKTANNLGYLYEDLKNYKEAVEWYKKDYIIFKSDNAANNLGYLYEDLKNYKEAIKWYEKAIERESFSAMKNLSLLYYKKLHNTVKAVEYFIPLIDNRYPKAKVLKFFKVKYHADEATIKKGYEAQLKSTIIPEKLKYKGGI